MSAQYTLKVPADKAKEMPMVDLAFEVLKAANTPFYYRDLMLEIAKVKSLSEEQMMNVIAQVYTEINIDGRFACVGANLWGLKRWYPVEKSEDTVAGSKRPRIINDEDDDLDEELYPEEEETYDAEEFDDFDTEQDEFAAEEVEENDFYEEEEAEEEEIEEEAIEGVVEDLEDDLEDGDDEDEAGEDDEEEK